MALIGQLFIIIIRHRIGLDWAAFGKHEKILKSRRVPLHVKTKVYASYILPVVLYGLDCITRNKALSSKIEVFQNHILRFLTGHKLTKSESRPSET